ncbi:hypothetical protein KY285_005217 [Solanum tuberosum]|nr:hypothetical protein KY285_005217 [Solanum tuberosum]
MKMWPTSNNPIVKPPKIKKLPGRSATVVHKGTIKEDVLQETRLVQATESSRGRGTGRVVGGRARASSSIQPPRASSQATTNNERGRGT